jgi:hypothetical protein
MADNQTLYSPISIGNSSAIEQPRLKKIGRQQTFLRKGENDFIFFLADPLDPMSA